MDRAEADRLVAKAPAHRHDRDDINVWTVDLLVPLTRTVDVEARDEEEAREKVAEFLAAESA